MITYSVFIISAAVALAVGIALGRPGRPYRQHYGYGPPYPYYPRRRGYYSPYDNRHDEPSGSGACLLAIIGLAAIFALLYLFFSPPSAGSMQQASTQMGTARAASTAAQQRPPDKTSYLEFGGYPDWDTAQQAKQQLSVAQEQMLDVVQAWGQPAPFRVVKGPFRNSAEAEDYRRRYRLEAEVVQYD